MPFTPPRLASVQLLSRTPHVCRLRSPVPPLRAAVPPPRLAFAGDFCGGTVWAPERAGGEGEAEGDSRGDRAEGSRWPLVGAVAPCKCGGSRGVSASERGIGSTRDPTAPSAPPGGPVKPRGKHLQRWPQVAASGQKLTKELNKRARCCAVGIRGI